MFVDSRNIPVQVNRRLFDLFLSRAKHLPLSVLLMTYTRIPIQFAPPMDRVRSLQLVNFLEPCKLDLLAHPAPSLEYLLLSPPPRHPIYSSSVFMEQDPVIFVGHTPSLRALALVNSTFLPRQPFPMLTELHISRMHSARFEDLLELLRATPALESLAVIDYHISSTWPRPAYPQAQAVPLRRLRRLAFVRTPHTRGLALLALLALPRDAAVQLFWPFVDRDVDPLTVSFPRIPPLAAATALELLVCGGRTLSFRTRVRGVDGSFVPVPRVQCAARRGTFSYGWWSWLWQTLPWAQLTTLRVAIDAEDDEFLPRFLDAAIVLTTLELRLYPRDGEQRGENGLGHLDVAPQALLGVCALLEEPLAIVCPCLAELAVIDASSTARAWDGFLSGDEASPRVAYVPDMLCVVAARAAAGRGLRRVALQGLWRRAQRDRVKSAFAMGAAVADFEFRELDVDSPPLFEFEEDQGEEAWVSEHWTYELPKITLPWVPVSGSG